MQRYDDDVKPRKMHNESKPVKLLSMTKIRLDGDSASGGDSSFLNILQQRGYSLGKTIGEGSYSKVKIAYKKTKDGLKKIACKMIDRQKASEEFIDKFLPREILILRAVRHPFIVRVHELIEIGQNRLYIFMDYCDKGDLLEYIRVNGYIPEPIASRRFRELISAVDYLHSLDIAHRDLKCENVFLVSSQKSSTDDLYHFKIGDFGFARSCRNTSGQRILSATFCGSAAYAAPEILEGTPYNPKMYDIWSLGCILFIMLTGTMPFDDSDAKTMLRYQRARRPAFPRWSDDETNLSSKAKSLICALLEPDVTRRATLPMVQNHPWMKVPTQPTTPLKSFLSPLRGIWDFRQKNKLTENDNRPNTSVN